MDILIVLQSYNYAFCPMKYNQQMGVMNQIMMNIGNSIGVTMSCVVQQSVNGWYEPTVAYKPSSVASTFIFSIMLLLIMCGLSRAMGQFSFERGKAGFKESVVQKTKSFAENLVNPDELIEKVKVNEEKMTKLEVFLSFYRGYVFDKPIQDEPDIIV